MCKSIVLRSGSSIRLGLDNRNEIEVECQSASVVDVAGAFRQPLNQSYGRAEPRQKLASFGRVTKIARKERKGNRRSGIAADR